MNKLEGNPNSTIKLLMLNGPLSGKSFDFIPGSKVHIGRIVRGNAVTIKDAGVSSKHLLIEFQMQTGRWIVSDLDSSNGTFLNGRLLDPFNPAEVSPGDVIKIGESTSISVEIRVTEEECLMQKNPPRRRGRNMAGKEKKKVDELEENGSKMDKSSHVEAKVEQKANAISVSSVKQEKISGVWDNSGESGVEVVEKVAEINEVPKRVTRGRGKKAVAVVDLKEQQDVVSQKRTTRSMKEGKVLESLEKNPTQANRKTRKGKKEKQNLETLVENVQLEKEDVVLNSDTKMGETNDSKSVNQVADMREEGAPFVANSSVEGSSNVATSSGSKHQNDVTLDLENMTIGELFDHWEVTMPKQIIEATELMISDMIEKSNKFHEFMRLQKMNGKE